jgi:hypothetical protein
MAKKRKIPKLTPEELERREETMRIFRERIAYRQARERELDEDARTKQDG